MTSSDLHGVTLHHWISVTTCNFSYKETKRYGSAHTCQSNWLWVSMIPSRKYTLLNYQFSWKCQWSKLRLFKQSTWPRHYIRAIFPRTLNLNLFLIKLGMMHLLETTKRKKHWFWCSWFIFSIQFSPFVHTTENNFNHFPLCRLSRQWIREPSNMG